MTHAYERVDGALYGHKTDLMDCFRKIQLRPDEIATPMWRWDDVDGGRKCSSNLVWMYPPERPPHDAAEYLRQLSRDKYPNEEFTAFLKIYTQRTSSRFRQYIVPSWLGERLDAHSADNSPGRHAGRGQHASSRGYMVAVEVGKRRGIKDIYVVRDIYIN